MSLNFPIFLGTFVAPKMQRWMVPASNSSKQQSLSDPKQSDANNNNNKETDSGTIMKHILSLTLVTLTDGSLDDTANVLAFEKAYDAYKVETESFDEEVSAAVHAQFDQYRGASQNMPALIHGALNRLDVGQNYQLMHDKVQNFIRQNSDRAEKKDKKTGEILQVAEAKRTRAFGIAKGKNGGCRRWSDVPVGNE